ncbi:MAG: ferredoxin family protein [Bacteroidales bacterium]|nr:ferredoxin family protein [Bacteroidales bacterium]
MAKYTICACSSRDFIERGKVKRIASSLIAEGNEVRIVDDLCGLCRDMDPSLGDMAEGTVIACHERAVRALFARAGITDVSDVVDIRSDCDPIPAVEDIPAVIGEEVEKRLSSFHRSEGKDPWFPVLDYSECISCRKCFDFCLFGVYTIEGGKVTVTNPDNCKNGCPACARTCLKGAIIFPKHPFAPINGGKEEESPEQQENPLFSIDPDALYAQAIKERLEYRRKAGMALRNPSLRKGDSNGNR